MPPALVRLLLDRRIGIRYATLFSLGVATFVLCHTISYWWLPESLLRGRSVGALATGGEAADSFGFEWGRIAAFNVVVMLLFYVAANLMRFTNGVPLVTTPSS